MLPSPKGGDAVVFEYALDKVLYESEHGSVTAKGTISFTTDFDLSVRLRWFKLKYFYFGNRTTESASLTIDSTLEYSLQKDVEIVSHTFKPFTFWIGTVPLVVVPVMTVYVGLDGSVHAGITMGVAQEASLTAGLKYESGSWGPVFNFSHEFNPIWPDLSIGLEVKAYTGVQLSMLLYGVAGPYAKVQVYVRLEADITEAPWWSLYAGLEVPVGVEIKVASKTILDYEKVVIFFEKLLAQANIPPDPPSSPSPPDGAVNYVIEPELSWQSSDPDGGTLTYDVYFEAGDSTPDVLVADDQPGTTFTPMVLPTMTTYYWQVVAKDTDGDTTAGPVWHFTTGNGEECLIELILNEPIVGEEGDVTIGGSATSACSTIDRIIWDWGDGNSDEQTFPATHFYGLGVGEIPLYYYPITATAYGNLGNKAVATTAVIPNLGHLGMTYIDPGEFQMGCDPANNAGYSCNPDEVPQHTVYLNGYWIDKNEITNIQYARCVMAGACSPPASNSSETRESYYDNPDYAYYPVVHLDWTQAQAYCVWREGRLPTEAEWEKAASGVEDARVWPWGSESPICSLANFDDCTGDTTQVGSYPEGASPYGALDMAGNVWEFVFDYYQDNYYASYPYDNPTGPETGYHKVMRGGVYYAGDPSLNPAEFYLRNTHRAYSYGGEEGESLGFRCVELP